MHKQYIAILALVAGLVVIASTATAAGAKGDPGVIKRGKCTAASTWKLKAKNDDGRIETEFEVDQNRVGKRWRVTIVRNGSRVFTGIRRTVAPSGSFEVSRMLANAVGTDHIVATARALSSGERCRAVLNFSPFPHPLSRPEAPSPVSAFLDEVLFRPERGRSGAARRSRRCGRNGPRS
jgi:hypothetical protein